MLVLYETSAGIALFKVLNEGKLEKVDDLYKDFETLEKAQKVVKLKNFAAFENTADALATAIQLQEGGLSKALKKFLKKNATGETLAVLDSKLGNIVKEKLGIQCESGNAILELSRGIRAHVDALISSVTGTATAPMALGLAHSLSRYKLKFSPDKVDTMIVQAIGLLDDLDKELNTYAMRVREWYGWHFPEMTKIVADNIQYAKSVKLMGTRENASERDFSGVLEEDVESALKDAAVISMGTEISVEGPQSDLANIWELCDQVIALSEYRGQLYDYLKSRMTAIAPNLTILVGELVGARLIAHAGSLMNLAKQPASTIQILGAEKALFRALKTKHDTPKYGLIYHASLVGQVGPKMKGKISRVLAAKAALSIRVDALGETADAEVGLLARGKIEARIRVLENKGMAEASGQPKGKPDVKKYDKDRQGASGALLTPPKAYNTDADVTMTTGDKKKKRKAENGDAAEAAVASPPAADGEGVEEKKKKKKKAAEAAEEAGPASDDEPSAKKKKKAKKNPEAEEAEAVEDEAPKKKKKKVAPAEEAAEPSAEKKKKKKTKE